MLRWHQVLIATFLSLASGATLATAQTPDDISFDGRAEMLFSEPLSQFLAASDNGKRFAPFAGTERCSGAWRGYKASWEIRNARLLLRQIDVAPCGEKPRLVPLHKLFLLESGDVSASWYTGVLVVPSGKLLNYVHLGYESLYERYTIFTVVQGVVVFREERSAPPNK